MNWKPAILSSFSLALVAATVFVLAGKDDEESEPDPAQPCERVLGKAGSEWITESSGELRESDFQPVDSLEHLKSTFNKYTQRARESSFPEEACDIRSSANSGGRFRLEFTPAFASLEEIEGWETEGRGRDTDTYPVNSSVVLKKHIKTSSQSYGREVYSAYVRCSTSESRHGEKQFLHGSITEDLTGDASTRVHLRHLLHATQVMADVIDCENKPDIPSEPPASVKD